MTIEHDFGKLYKFFLSLSTNAEETVSGFWLTAADYMQRQTLLRFRFETDPDGKPWKALSALTKMMRRKGRKSKRGAKILQSSGKLMKGTVSYMKSPTELVIENKVPYAGVHQFGASMKVSEAQAWAISFKAYNFSPDVWGSEKKLSAKQRKRSNLVCALAYGIMGKTITIFKRQVLGFSKEDVNKIVTIWTDWWDNIVRRS